MEKEAILSTKPLGRCSLWNYHIQPELLEQINTNYFKVEPLCWGFSEYSWWSFIAPFVNLQCGPLSQCAEQGCCKAREGLTDFSLTMLSNTCVQPLPAARCTNTDRGLIAYYESFVEWEDPQSSPPSRIGPFLGSLLKETSRAPHGLFKQPQLQMRNQRSLRTTNWPPVPSQSKEGYCMFPNQCSWGHTSPSPYSSSREHASSSSYRRCFLAHCQTLLQETAH